MCFSVARYLRLSSDLAHAWNWVSLARAGCGGRRTSMNTGTMGMPDTPASLQACSRLGGVGIGGAAGAMGG